MLLSAFLSILAIITSCNDDKDEMNYYHRVKPIKSIYATFVDGNHRFVPNQTNLDADTIKISFPYYYPEDSEDKIDISKMKVSIEYNEDISVITPLPEIVDLTKYHAIEMKNADGSTDKIIITGEAKKEQHSQNHLFRITSGQSLWYNSGI